MTDHQTGLFKERKLASGDGLNNDPDRLNSDMQNMSLLESKRENLVARKCLSAIQKQEKTDSDLNDSNRRRTLTQWRVRSKTYSTSHAVMTFTGGNPPEHTHSFRMFAQEFAKIPQRKRPPRSQYVIRSGRISVRRWDRMMFAMLVYTCIVTPFEVAYMKVTGIVFVFNCIVEICFFSDMALHFIRTAKDINTGENLLSVSHISNNYLRSWFLIDLASSLPFDLVSWLASFLPSNDHFSPTTLRGLRLCRLLKLLRIAHGSEFVQSQESLLGLSFTAITVLKCAFGMLLVAHWLACALYILPKDPNHAPQNTWVYQAGVWDASPYQQYLRSLYWAISIITSLGFGDITPQNEKEVVLCTICTCIGAICYAFSMGNICDIFARLYSTDNVGYYMRTMDVLNLYMEEVRLPKEMRENLREFFVQNKQQQRFLFYHDVLRKMSPGLRGNFADHCNGGWINAVPFLRALPDGKEATFAQEIALALKMQAFPPFEAIIRKGEEARHMYIIRKGICARLGRVLTKGTCVGQDVILSEGAKRHCAVLTLTHTGVHALARDKIFEILNCGKFPMRRRLVRKAAVRLMVIRGVIAIARECREHRGFKVGGWLSVKHDVERKINDDAIEQEHMIRMRRQTIIAQYADQHNSSAQRGGNPVSEAGRKRIINIRNLRAIIALSQMKKKTRRRSPHGRAAQSGPPKVATVAAKSCVDDCVPTMTTLEAAPRDSKSHQPMSLEAAWPQLLASVTKLGGDYRATTTSFENRVKRIEELVSARDPDLHHVPASTIVGPRCFKKKRGTI